MANELTYPQGFINAINNIPTSAPPFAFIHVNYPAGSTCYAESTDGDYLAAQNTDGEYTFVLPEPIMDEATWTVSCTDGTDSDSINVVINSYQQIENIILKYADPVLNNNSWETISTMAQRGAGDTYWDIGDCKEIVLNGKIGSSLTLSNFTTYIFILDFNYPMGKTTPDNNIIFGGFKSALTNGKDIVLCDSKWNTQQTSLKCFNINHWSNSNNGGWPACDLRYDILGANNTQPSSYGVSKATSCTGDDATYDAITNPVANTLMAALPNDFRSVLKLYTHYVNNRYQPTSGSISNSVQFITDAGISLLSEYEIFGSNTYASTYEPSYQKQINYYQAGNSKIRYKHNSIDTASYWWTCSPTSKSSVSGTSHSNSWCFVELNGTTYAYYTNVAYGLAPIFKI